MLHYLIFAKDMLVKFLMSDFVEAITELEAKKAELDSQIKAASPKDAEGVDFHPEVTH